MADNNIYELIQKWCEHQRRSVYSLYKEEGARLTESTIRSIRDGGNPEYETLKVLANELHVPVPDFLAGPKGSGMVLTDEEWKLIEMFRSLNKSQYDLAIRLLTAAKLYEANNKQ